MSNDVPQPKSATQLAIEFLTLWRESEARRPAAAAHISETLGLSSVDEPARSKIASAIAGLLNLSMISVLTVGAYRAAEETGRSRDEVTSEELQAAATTFVQDLSLGMPDDPRPNPGSTSM
ncbi:MULTISPECIES: hypothetical protein [unclassified Streptomyces]|uniref:hypothetical protein n=1 Tax=unclassified Streptomyces TaxID=2593676 RepID=UPI00131C709B|nr:MULTISPECIES: hypothetical protein [unclassified Streptomyces]